MLFTTLYTHIHCHLRVQGVTIGCVNAIYCCAESVQNNEETPSAHYFGPKGFTK